MKNIIYFGFISIISLMIILSILWLVQVNSSNKSILDLIKQYDEKIEHANAMSHATRVRQISLLNMLIIDDPFELDNEIIKFYGYAMFYRAAREALFSMPMSKEERSLHERMDKLTSKSQPLSKIIVRMFEEQIDKKEILIALSNVRALQEELFTTVDRFVLLQRSLDEEAIKHSNKKFNEELYFIVAVGLIAILFAIIISRYVARYVLDKDAELRLANDDMAKAYKKSEEATTLKSEFLATMSHEIRTPLTAIIGFAETTLYSNQSMEQRLSSIQTIIRSGKHLLQVINDILDLSKIEANKLEIESSSVSLFELLNEIEDFEKSIAEEKDIKFSINYTYPLPSEIKTDSLRLKQILLNLCNNALKFTESGFVSIDVSSNENAILFEVNDSGVGISKENQSVIFEAYRQADSSTTRKFGGTGLGLSLSKLLTERMGGTLKVDSVLGEGSKFKLYLPYESVMDEKIITEASCAPKINCRVEPVIVSDGLSGRVLLAEDNVDNQELFMIILERVGVDVTIVDNGMLAVEAVANNDFDLILMDMRMPVMGGLEATKLIREQGFTKPIIAVTANAMQEDRNDCFNAGCDDFLTKPIDSKIFNDTLEKYLDIRMAKSHKSHSMLSSLVEDDTNMINLVKRFVASMEATLENTEKLINEMDWNELSSVLHNLKGTAGNFGFQEVSNLAAKMEFQTANHSQDELLKLLDNLKESYKQMLLGIEES